MINALVLDRAREISSTADLITVVGCLTVTFKDEKRDGATLRIGPPYPEKFVYVLRRVGVAWKVGVAWNISNPDQIERDYRSLRDSWKRLLPNLSETTRVKCSWEY